MNGEEIFKRCIEFKGPERLPLLLGCPFGWLYEKDLKKEARIRELESLIPDDLLSQGLGSWINPFGEVSVNDGVRRWKDEWGVAWIDDGHGARVEDHLMEEGYFLFDTINFPDPDLPGRFEKADGILMKSGGRYVLSNVWFTLFERLWMLRGFNNMLMDPYLERKSFCRLRERVLEVNLAFIDRWIERGVDGIFFSDDWGSQRGLLMNPDDWRALYKPAYKLMFERVREGGAHVWMHLCGDVSAIIPDLIDIGLNVINPIQPQAMDIHWLSREFGGKVCFYGGVDVQGRLINGTPEEVKRDIHQLVKLFEFFEGGYIGSTSHSIMPETPLDNIIAMYEAFAEYL